MAKRAFANPFHDFCQEQRPLLPADLKGSEKEQLLGQWWQALSPAAKAKRKVILSETLRIFKAVQYVFTLTFR